MPEEYRCLEDYRCIKDLIELDNSKMYVNEKRYRTELIIHLYDLGYYREYEKYDIDNVKDFYINYAIMNSEP